MVESWGVGRDNAEEVSMKKHIGKFTISQPNLQK